MKKIISPLLKYGIPVALSVLLVWFFYKNMDMEAIKQSLREDVNFWWFVPVIVVSIFSHVFRACRWRLQLRALGIDAPLSALVNSIFGTYFVNLLAPRLGEVWRSGYIASRERTSFSKVVGSMVGDRLSDTLTVLALTIVTFFLAQGAFMKFLSQKGAASGESMFATWWFWALVAVGALMVALMVWVFKTKSENKVLTKIRLMLTNLWEGLISITKMKGKWWFLLYTLLIWGCYFFQLYIASMAFTFTKDLGIVAILVLFVFSSLGMAVPTNGGVGAWQYAIMFGLAIYGVGELPLGDPYNPQASAFAWTVWLVQQVLLVVLGIYAFVSMAIDRRRIAQGKTIVRTKSDAEGMTL
ncbi:MAG: lysylphosphatidylglycerol synthase transmembrane domain-containing protein [Sodaliphilus sp.]|nr:flippase-like domain-containing protein [Bacteroidales bacterium]MDY2865642.1 lysylphosphatidylglycerol synthase transmembrane domain-containing protein [Sodaliphilus sp.]MCI6935021.1 flippase-like domain-containing protein [Bacteroidales bacterium]MCI6985333.1 flippase-like domain-containing protein [Bacteroidales bacterium]MDY3683254.1 lysylphosphatidylglycerol synthase transmembrane domain-containing protein [Sodaliphilus sp.]